ncbi:small acid-soluble spore protein Tlp [Cohnella panacarvi]|uniref:small acid-soluble spore protein Tlp n=1 Tax=Cohnella panacarvi TaxID=400776 RepID=UPI000479F99E|nr:small acid-soluble spore protein Tlp [Cohnella panacarvi]
MAKPDDRSDNVNKLQEARENTMENISQTEHYLDEHAVELGDTEKQQLEGKNARRRQAVQGMQEEILDEKNQY